MGRPFDTSISGRGDTGPRAFVVRGAGNQILVILSGFDAADAAAEYTRDGHPVDEVDPVSMRPLHADALSLTA